LANRVICKDCSTNFNVLLHGDMDKCNECGWKLYCRNDDSDTQAVENRLSVYKNDIVPALDILDELWYLVKIDGTQSIEKVFEDILNIIK
jgi:adenylate kinase